MVCDNCLLSPTAEVLALCDDCNSIEEVDIMLCDKCNEVGHTAEVCECEPRITNEVVKLDGDTGFTILSSGKQEEFDTGAKRDSQEGKGRFDLLWPFALAAEAVHMQKGAEHYDARNWEKGMPVSRFISSGIGHVFKYLAGMTDENHLVAAGWNIMCAIDTRERVKRGLLPAELDDLPPDSVKYVEHLGVEIAEMAELPDNTGPILRKALGKDDPVHCHTHKHSSIDLNTVIQHTHDIQHTHEHDHAFKGDYLLNHYLHNHTGIEIQF